MPQRQCSILIKDEVSCAVIGLTDAHKDQMVKKFAMLVPNRFHMAKFKLGVWDGKIPFFREAGETYVNLLGEIIPILEDYDYDIKLVDKRKKVVYTPNPIDENYFGDIMLGGKPLTLRDHQVEVINALLESGGGIGKLATGGGKCQAPETPIIMFDGTVKQIKDIVVGDKLLGDDNTPRTVLDTTRGRSPMYRIDPVSKGHDSWICNNKHILTLVANCNRGICKKDEVIDIGIDDYLKQTKTFKHITKQFSVGFDGWDKTEFPIEPYLIGLWLGDGDRAGPTVHTIDEEIKNYLYEWADERDVRVSVYNQFPSECKGYRLNCKANGRNWIYSIFKEFINSDGVKFIPSEYLTSSREQRLQLLAGLIDTDGSLDLKGSGYEITQKSKPLSDAIMILGRSLGYRVSRAEKVINDVIYHRMYLSGDFSDLPVILPRKKQRPSNPNKDYLRTGFTVTKLPENDYVGIVVDGNNRYLQSDFTVVHNTFITAALTRIHEEMDDLRVITIVPNKTLVKQTYKDYVMLGIDSGIYYGDKKDTNHKHLVSTWQSLIKNPHMMKDYDVVIVDEVHLAKGQSLQDLLIKHGRHIAYRYGVTGTMPKEDIDKMAVNIALGQVVVDVNAASLIEKKLLSNLNISIYELEHNVRTEYDDYIKTFRKSLTRPEPLTYAQYKDGYLPDYASEKSYNSQHEEHMIWIASKLSEIRNEHGNVLCLVDGIKHGQRLAELIDDSHFLSGADKVEAREAVYEQYATNNDMLTIATAQIASTGLNIKRIFALCYINFGKSGIKVIQSVGRGLRMDDDKDFVAVFDFTNDFKYSKRHTNERIKFYKEEQYPYTKKKVKFSAKTTDLFD